MARVSLVTFSLLLISCGHRAAPTLDGPAARSDGASTDHAHAGDQGASCSGLAKVSIDGVALRVEQVKGEDYISAAHSEGARVQLIAAAASGDRWEISADVMSRLGQTIADKPLPRTVEIGPPVGLDSTIFFRKPPGCASEPCLSDLLSTEYHKLWGYVTLKGTDYRSPLQLELCLSGSDAGGVHPGTLEVHAVQIYAPAVTIPRWQLPW
jgi:hypothetical protein